MPGWSILVSDIDSQLSRLAQATQRNGGEPAISTCSIKKYEGKEGLLSSLCILRYRWTSDGDDLYWRCQMGVASTCLMSGWLHNAQITSVKANLVPMVRQWKLAGHQFQGTSIWQVVLLDTMDQPWITDMLRNKASKARSREMDPYGSTHLKGQ